MYHPTRGGVRGGRDQFSWDDVKVDKHRENYLGHSIKAPVGRWQKGKDLFWYAKDKKALSAEMEAAKEEIKRIKEEEEQAMREALGLAPKRASRPQGNRLDKHEYSELVKRGSTAEDMGAGHAEAARVDGLGFSSFQISRRAPRPWEESSSSAPTITDDAPKVENVSMPIQSARKTEEDESEDESRRQKRRREERKQEKRERREKRHSRDSDDRKKHRKDKEKRRHDSD
ncbi:multiple myeloma tumor-associated protein 2-like protein [Senna tora]|uniref:Multiple myeloma tumor-associated protein 2-like protein n=1 Tax=Senna tora TaxID=362788 RepID=A0A834TES4_9FABA|nr:multiple myeloma tumor-associated protein 2-like protein [Senna tora]